MSLECHRRLLSNLHNLRWRDTIARKSLSKAHTKSQLLCFPSLPFELLESFFSSFPPQNFRPPFPKGRRFRDTLSVKSSSSATRSDKTHTFLRKKKNPHG
ncbi:hypothetical protein CDAR_473781 [Caerostris darwini]|uniref:Uncharacterized protein n=1 Tax=Caerostris darwini TaxID=1538125 RepID=A0AAV4SAQ8_9ARAC|nr:hypothetical protein CDAR_473781 [Caerostris darwini]